MDRFRTVASSVSVARNCALFLTVTCLISCANSVIWTDHLLEPLPESELAGTYRLIYLSASKEEIEEIDARVDQAGQVPTILLNADNSFRFLNVPFFVQRQNDGSVYLEKVGDACGKWQLIEAGSARGIFGRKTPYFGIAVDGVGSAMSHLDVDRSRHHHLTYNFATDSSLGSVMIFCPEKPD